MQLSTVRALFGTAAVLAASVSIAHAQGAEVLAGVVECKCRLRRRPKCRRSASSAKATGTTGS